MNYLKYARKKKKRSRLPNLSSLAGKKRGAGIFSEKLLFFIPDTLFTVVVIVITYVIVLAIIVNRTNVADAESAILMNYAHYSKDGFSRFDEGLGSGEPGKGRVYPGVVDEGRFTTVQLQSLFALEKPQTAGRFVKNQTIIDYLRQQEAKLPSEPVRCMTTEKGGPINCAYTNEEKFSRWLPIAKVRGKGEGGKTPYGELRYVITADGKGAVMETVFIASN